MKNSTTETPKAAIAVIAPKEEEMRTAGSGQMMAVPVLSTTISLRDCASKFTPRSTLCFQGGNTVGGCHSDLIETLIVSIEKLPANCLGTLNHSATSAIKRCLLSFLRLNEFLLPNLSFHFSCLLHGTGSLFNQCRPHTCFCR